MLEEESDYDDEEKKVYSKQRKKKARIKKGNKDRKQRGGKLNILSPSDEFGRIWSIPNQNLVTSSKKLRHASDSTPKTFGTATASAPSLVEELSEIYHSIVKGMSGQYDSGSSNNIAKMQEIERDTFLNIRAKTLVFPSNKNFNIYDFAKYLDLEREEFNRSLHWLKYTDDDSSYSSPCLSVTRQLSLLSSPSLSHQTSVQLFSMASKESDKADEVMCPKLLGDKIDEIKRVYKHTKEKVDQFYDLLSSLYSSSVSWMDGSYFKWSDEDRAQFRNAVIECRPTLGMMTVTLNEKYVRDHPELISILGNLEGINSWCYFVYSTFEKLYTLGKLISNCEESAFNVAYLNFEDEVRKHKFEPFLTPASLAQSADATDLDSQMRTFIETYPDYAAKVGMGSSLKNSVKPWVSRKGNVFLCEDWGTNKGALMLVKSKLHKLLLRLREALKLEMDLGSGLKSNLQREQIDDVIVLDDNQFCFFDFISSSKSSESKLSIFDKYLQELCNGPEKGESMECYKPFRALPSLLYIYVYLVRLERCICAFQMQELKQKLYSEDNIASLSDKSELENKVRLLVSVILIAVCEKVYVSKLIMPFIGSFEFESHPINRFEHLLLQREMPALQKSDLFTETYQYEKLLQAIFADYSRFFYENFTYKAPSSFNPDISPPNSRNNSFDDDNEDVILVFDKSFATYHWKFTCKVLPYIAGGCHSIVDSFRRATKFYLEELSHQINFTVNEFNLILKAGDHRENSPQELMKLHSKLKSFQLCSRNVSSFATRVLKDLSICTLFEVHNVEKFFRSIKDTHLLVEIHDKYLNPTDDSSQLTNQPACYLVKETLTNNLTVLKDLLLAVVNKHPTIRRGPEDANDSPSSFEKTDSSSRVCKVGPSAYHLSNSVFTGPSMPSLSSALDSQPKFNSSMKFSVDFLSQNGQTPTGISNNTTPVGSFNMNSLNFNRQLNDTTDSGPSLPCKSSSPDNPYLEQDAYLIIMNAEHIKTWNKVCENDRKRANKSKFTVLPPFYSFIPELTPAEDLQTSFDDKIFEVGGNGDIFENPDFSNAVLESNELALISFYPSISNQIVNSNAFKYTSVKASPVPRHKGTREEFAKFYHSEGGHSASQKSDDISSYSNVEMPPVEGDDQSSGSSTVDDLSNSFSHFVLHRPVLINLFEELITHVESCTREANNYMDAFESQNKSPFMQGKTMESKLFVRCKNFLTTLTLIAMQYARDIFQIIPQKHPSGLMQVFSRLCLKLAFVLIDYLLTIHRERAGIKTKPSVSVAAFLKFVAGDSISSNFSHAERTKFKNEAERMFKHTADSSALRRNQESRNSSKTTLSKRSRREIKRNKWKKYQVRSGVHFHNGLPDCDAADVTDSFNVPPPPALNVVEDKEDASEERSSVPVTPVAASSADTFPNEEDASISSSDEDSAKETFPLGPYKKMVQDMAERRRKEVRSSVLKCEGKINSINEIIVGKVIDSNQSKNLVTRIVGNYVKFSFKTGRVVPKSSARVVEGIREDNGMSIAVKKIKFGEAKNGTGGEGVILERHDLQKYIESLSKETRQELVDGISEVEQLMKLKQSDHVVTFYGLALSPGHIYICMELFEQSLKSLAFNAHEYNTFCPIDFRYIFHQVVHALKYIHSRGIVHMDVKAENVFIKSSPRPGQDDFYFAKLGDFGLTVDASGAPRAYFGTPGFIAIELMRGEENRSSTLNPSCDIWSLGCTVIQVFCGVTHPIVLLAGLSELDSNDKSGENHDILCARANFSIIYSGEVHLPTIDVQRGITKDCVSFLEKCLEIEPTERSTAAQLATHPFVQIACD